MIAINQISSPATNIKRTNTIRETPLHPKAILETSFSVKLCYQIHYIYKLNIQYLQADQPYCFGVYKSDFEYIVNQHNSFDLISLIEIFFCKP